MRAARAAFTLLELLVVVVIVGLVATAVVARTDGFTDSGRLHSAARRVLSSVQVARTQALRTGRSVRVTYDAVGRTIRIEPYWPSRPADGAEPTAADRPVGTNYLLPEGVNLLRVSLDESSSDGSAESAEVGPKSVRVTPVGLVAPHRVELTTAGGRRATVDVDLLGDGRVSLPPQPKP